MKKNRLFTLFLFLSICFSLATSAQLPSFPGAEGFGSHAVGGRGGKVVQVINTNDTGVGSLRWAVTQFPNEPLTIVFRVSGIIELQSELYIKRSYLTIAGQTAPGDGICIKGNSVIINGARSASQGGNHGHIIVRYIRFRPGSYISSGVYGLDMENAHDVILDHCSFSWANEENLAMYDSKNVTVQWCISSEGLYSANHMKGNRGYNGVWGGQYSSFHHNLIAHCNSRTIRYNGARAHDTMALVDSRNNVIYNSRSSGSCYGGEVQIPGGFSHINIINSYYKNGPATPSSWKFVNASYNSTDNGVGRWYLTGNVMTGSSSYTTNNKNGIDVGNIPSASQSYAKADTEFVIPAWAAVTTDGTDSGYYKVLGKAGAILPLRDSVDMRIANETLTGTAIGTGVIGNGIIDSPSVVGGWQVYNSIYAPMDTDEDGMPNYWEISMGLNPNDSADRNGISSTGYTNLEDYLNGITGNVTSVEKEKLQKQQQITLYPNPAGAQLNMQHPVASDKEVIMVYDIKGKLMATINIAKGNSVTTIDVSSLSAGIYYALYKNKVSSAAASFIKQ